MSCWMSARCLKGVEVMPIAEGTREAVANMSYETAIEVEVMPAAEGTREASSYLDVSTSEAGPPAADFSGNSHSRSGRHVRRHRIYSPERHRFISPQCQRIRNPQICRGSHRRNRQRAANRVGGSSCGGGAKLCSRSSHRSPRGFAAATCRFSTAKCLI